MLTLKRIGAGLAMSVWVCALATKVQAATWVISGDIPATSTRVAIDLRVEASELTGTGLDDRVAALPFLAVGGAEITVCEGTGVVDPADLLTKLVAAERALDYAEFGDAQTALDRFFADMRCLREPMETDKISRGFFIRALVSLGLGDETKALSAFEDAIAMSPDLVWDPNYPPSGVPFFDQAKTQRSATPQATLRVIPQASRVHVDGAQRSKSEAAIAVGAGTHLVQIERERLWGFSIDLGAGQNAVVLQTAALLKEASSMVERAENRAHLAAIFAVIFDAEDKVAIRDKNGTWLWSADTDSWRFHATPTSVRADQKTTLWARRIGATVGVSSGFVSIVSLGQAQNWANQVNNATTGTKQSAAFEEFERADRRWVVARSLALVGSALFAGSWVLDSNTGTQWTPWVSIKALGIAIPF
jgi:hypothetical protein